ncbi:methylenetetrahydrofolate reductase [Microbacterium sp. A8/3-1]|uniref:Methylenetetrahydrofolate reductase n=1 Tax=Microbacterium sp. A8/3-1 TaxID=3160749 RepID=A0AAU7VYT2_9MICO
MTDTHSEAQLTLAELLKDFSLEVTGKEQEKLADAADHIPQGTRVNVTYLGNEDRASRVGTAASARRLGFTPVPHISARLVDSETELRDFLSDLGEADAAHSVFVIAGDPPAPHGPYSDALAVIDTGLFAGHGVEDVSISGYPEGHPSISAAKLWDALEDKIRSLERQGIPTSITTQFSFDADRVLDWIAEVRRRGFDLPIRIGVPGPAGVRRLVRFASRFGIASSAGIVKKYGFSLTNLLGTAGPDRFLADITEGYSREVHGDLRVHFYTFGDIEATSRWVEESLAVHR